MDKRQYNDEEVAAIFERASETDHAALPQSAEGKGLTLAALQDIGREVGISPESIALAARSLEQVGRPASIQRRRGGCDLRAGLGDGPRPVAPVGRGQGLDPRPTGATRRG